MLPLTRYLRVLAAYVASLAFSLPEIRDKLAVARAHQGHNGCEFVYENVWRKGNFFKYIDYELTGVRCTTRNMLSAVQPSHLG